jgi:hypothetical protein
MRTTFIEWQASEQGYTPNCLAMYNELRRSLALPPDRCWFRYVTDHGEACRNWYTALHADYPSVDIPQIFVSDEVFSEAETVSFKLFFEREAATLSLRINKHDGRLSTIRIDFPAGSIQLASEIWESVFFNADCTPTAFGGLASVDLPLRGYRIGTPMGTFGIADVARLRVVAHIDSVHEYALSSGDAQFPDEYERLHALYVARDVV